MRQTCPLPATHPELTIFHRPDFIEYRVNNWRLARDGSGRVVRGTCMWSWVDIAVLGAVVFSILTWVCRDSEIQGGFQSRCPARFPAPRALLVHTLPILLLFLLVYTRCTQVLHESLLLFPTLGIQLETHLGHPLFQTHPFFSRQHFIPLSALEDVVIHEGFRRWQVRYYLAALYRVQGSPSVGCAEGEGIPGPGVVRVRVAFEHILPYFPVLHEVYLGVQQTLFPPLTRIIETSDPETEMEKDA